MRLTALLALMLALAGCGGSAAPQHSAPSHSPEWQQGYSAGTAVYQQAAGIDGGPSPESPDDASLVSFCGEMFGQGNQPGEDDWLAGYKAVVCGPG